VSTDDPVFADELDEYLAEALRDPGFRAAYERAQHWETHHPRPLAIDGREYRRRQKARRRRRRG
jgi:hypothetical protein